MAKNKLALKKTLEKISSTDLLNSSLNIPNLPEVFRNMNTISIVALIKKVGIEDSGEIMTALSPKQMREIMEEELWTSKLAGDEEHFSLKKAIKLLQVWNEQGEDFVAHTLLNLGREFLATFIIHFADVREITGIAWDMLDIDGLGSILYEEDNPFRHIYDHYDLYARYKDIEFWEQFKNALDVLWQNNPDSLEDAFALCCNRSQQEEYDEEDKQREKIDEIEELLRNELSHARELRRAMSGYIEPEQARIILMKCRHDKLNTGLKIFIQKKQEALLNAFNEKASQIVLEQEDDIQKNISWLEIQNPDKMLALTTQENIAISIQKLESRIYENKLEISNLLLEQENDQKNIENNTESYKEIPFDKIQAEMAGLANLLLAGANAGGRKFEIDEAFVAVISLIKLYLTDNNLPNLDPSNLFDAFEYGLQLLHEKVAIKTAIALDDILRSNNKDHEIIRYEFIKICTKREAGQNSFVKLLKENRFIEASKLFAEIENVIPNNIAICLKSFLSEYPVIPNCLLEKESFNFYKKQKIWEWSFIINSNHFAKIDEFLQELPIKI